MTGVDLAARKLILEMDNLLSRRANTGKVDPEAKGVVVTCIMTCAYYCEVALKTLQSSLNGGYAFTGHDLEQLYRKVENSYSEVLARSLEDDLLHEIKNYYPELKLDGSPVDVVAILTVGANSFTEWRYGWQENRSERMANGIPRHLYAIAAGLFNLCLKRNPELWGAHNGDQVVHVTVGSGPNRDGTSARSTAQLMVPLNKPWGHRFPDTCRRDHRFITVPDGHSLASAIGEGGETIDDWNPHADGVTWSIGPLSIHGAKAETFTMVIG